MEGTFPIYFFQGLSFFSMFSICKILLQDFLLQSYCLSVFFVTGHADYCDLDCFSGCIVYPLACIPAYSCSLLVVVVNYVFFCR